MSASQAAIDHIIILLPYKDVVEPPTWLTDHFTISPGGRHADGKTENRLIVFQDGTYIELIAFINDDPAHRSGHWWDKEYGTVDYALTSAGRFDPNIRKRLESAVSGITFAKPQAGGRTRPDGVRMEWEVTFPQGTERGMIPFWCHDITPRERRVPKQNRIHPSGALGVSAVLLKLPRAQIEQMDKALAAVFGTGSTRLHQITAPEEVPGTQNPHVETSEAEEDASHYIQLSLQTDRSTRHSIVRKVGNGEVTIRFDPVTTKVE